MCNCIFLKYKSSHYDGGSYCLCELTNEAEQKHSETLTEKYHLN